jgi:hypothetical protein
MLLYNGKTMIYDLCFEKYNWRESLAATVILLLVATIIRTTYGY